MGPPFSVRIYPWPLPVALRFLGAISRIGLPIFGGSCLLLCSRLIADSIRGRPIGLAVCRGPSSPLETKRRRTRPVAVPPSIRACAVRVRPTARQPTRHPRTPWEYRCRRQEVTCLADDRHQSTGHFRYFPFEIRQVPVC